MRYGIKSVTMDDVARNLGMSKKTLYKYVTDKRDLVKKVMMMGRQEDVRVISEVMSKNLNAIDENFEISKFVVEKVKNIHPSIFYDLEKYYSDAWKVFEEHKQEFIYDCVYQNLEKGMKEGLYRNDLNASIISKLYVSKMDDIWDTQLFPPGEYRFDKVYMEMFRYHIRGIASDKGIEYLIEKVKKEKSNL